MNHAIFNVNGGDAKYWIELDDARFVFGEAVKVYWQGSNGRATIMRNRIEIDSSTGANFDIHVPIESEQDLVRVKITNERHVSTHVSITDRQGNGIDQEDIRDGDTDSLHVKR